MYPLLSRSTCCSSPPIAWRQWESQCQCFGRPLLRSSGSSPVSRWHQPAPPSPPRRKSSSQEPDPANRGCWSRWILMAVIHIWMMLAVGTKILFQWKNHSLVSPWSSQRMLRFVPWDTNIGNGDNLSCDRPVFLHVGSNRGSNISSPLGFPALRWHRVSVV